MSKIDKIQTKYKGYFVDFDGNVYGKRGKMMSPSMDRNGYMNVCIMADGKSKTVMVHRLIGETLVENINNLKYINHIDGDKSNNNAGNLEWCTKSYNTIHSFNNQLQKVIGNQYGTFSVVDKIVYEKFIELRQSGLTFKEIGEITGFNRRTVSNYINNKRRFTNE